MVLNEDYNIQVEINLKYWTTYSKVQLISYWKGSDEFLEYENFTFRVDPMQVVHHLNEVNLHYNVETIQLEILQFRQVSQTLSQGTPSLLHASNRPVFPIHPFP